MRQFSWRNARRRALYRWSAPGTSPKCGTPPGVPTRAAPSLSATATAAQSTPGRAAGETVSAPADPGATMLMLAFGPSRYRSLVGGVSQSEVAAAFPGWEMLTVEPGDTVGLGWPMNRTAPQWYRLRR